MATVDDARAALAKRLSEFQIKRPTRLGYLGDGRGFAASNLQVPGYPDHVYVRDTLNARRFSIVLNRGRVAPAFNLPVTIGFLDDEPNAEQVLGVHYGGLGQGTEGRDLMVTGPHRTQHQFGGGDDVFIDSRLFLPGLVHPTNPASMQVTVKSFIYFSTRWRTFSESASLDLTEYVPSSTSLGIALLISFDPVGAALRYRRGPEFFVTYGQIPNEFENVPPPAADEYPLGIIFLVGGMTRIDWGYVSNSVVDARLFLNTPLSGILDRLQQLEGISGNDPDLPCCGAE